MIRNPTPRCSVQACYPVCQDNSPLGAGVIEPGHMGLLCNRVREASKFHRCSGCESCGSGTDYNGILPDLY